MLLTEIGKDIITVNETNYKDWCNDKIHIIKLSFIEPTKYKIYKTFDNYKKTNRFIIEDNIRFYNYILKNLNKKYYIENTINDRIISFFKKNNKVVLNWFKLEAYEKQCLCNEGFLNDVLSNLEVIIICIEFYEDYEYILKNWSGNVIISNGDDI